VGLVASPISGSMQAKAFACDLGEVIRLTDPTVIVIEGPGDAGAEEERWARLPYAYMEGPHQITLGQATFHVEREE